MTTQPPQQDQPQTPNTTPKDILPPEIRNNPEKLNALVSIMGIGCSDAYIGESNSKNRTDCKFILCSKDRELCEVISRDLTTLTGKQFLIRSIIVDNKEYFRIAVAIISFVRKLLSFSMFGTWTWRIPKFIFNLVDNLKSLFLARMLDGDGDIDKDGYYIRHRSVNQNGLKDIQTLLLQLGIDSRIYKKSLFVCHQRNYQKYASLLLPYIVLHRKKERLIKIIKRNYRYYPYMERDRGTP